MQLLTTQAVWDIFSVKRVNGCRSDGYVVSTHTINNEEHCTFWKTSACQK